LNLRSFFVPVLILVLVVPILLGGGYVVSRVLRHSFDTSDSRRAARTLNFTLLKDQLDEETGVRGYTSIPEPRFLEPYDAARAEFPAKASQLRARLAFLRIPGTQAMLDDAIAANEEWLTTVARPLLSAPHGAEAGVLQFRGKALVDRFRADSDRLDEALVAREGADNRATQAAIDNVSTLVLFAVLLIVVIAAASSVAQARLSARLEAARRRAESEARANLELRTAFETEKRIADTLQSAFAQHPLPVVPTLSFSATYIPATDEAKVGGDWYDAVELPKGRVLFSLGDVEGHGIEAAVNMSRARQALISSALVDPDPAQVLRRVNGQLLTSGRMATAVAGYADAASYEFVYATAGHPPPLLLLPGRAPVLLECGGLPLGVMDGCAYRTRRVQAVPGAVLVLYTDGAVEHSRNVIEGEALLMQAARTALENNQSDLAASIRTEIFGGRPVGDDVAILTIGFASGETTRMTFAADSAQGAVVSRLSPFADPPARATELGIAA
jgi:serine phosphatase RsbU (regulator of sigma subunit)